MNTEGLEDIEDVLGDEIEEGAPDDSEAEGEDDDTGDEEDDGEEGGGDGAEEGQLVVTIGDEEEEKAPQWVKDLRREVSEKNRRIRELEAKVNGATETQTELRAKPTLADHDYDDGAYTEDLEKWFTEKTEHDKRTAQKQEAEQRQAERWQAKMTAFEEGKKALKVRDLDEAEAIVTGTLSQIQMGIVVEAAKNPALVFYAMGKNPKKAEEMAKIDSPIEFARAVFEMEGNLKVTNRGAPPPERTIRGGKAGGAADNTLEKLREQAAKTGDYSKVMDYKRKKRA